MSNYMGDITNYLSAGTVNAAAAAKTSESKSSLDMTDFLTLMVTELTNQSIDSTADTSDMLNQLVQMQMVQALTNMTDASIMSYAASLVGKEITVGQYDATGTLQEVVGVVSGTGTYGGEQVVFVNDKYYYMSEIMAVGRLPQKEAVENTPVQDDIPVEKSEAVEEVETVEEPDEVRIADEAVSSETEDTSENLPDESEDAEI